MNPSPWEAVARLALAIISMADTKAWFCIAITLCVFAGLARVMRSHADVMSKFSWRCGFVSMLVMGIGIVVGLWVTYARGAFINAQRGPGIVDFRRGHLGDDKAFENRAAKAKPEDFDREFRELSRDYFTIADAKYFSLTLCLITSASGWLLASISVALALQSVRNEAIDRIARAASQQASQQQDHSAKDELPMHGDAPGRTETPLAAR